MHFNPSLFACSLPHCSKGPQQNPPATDGATSGDGEEFEHGPCIVPGCKESGVSYDGSYFKCNEGSEAQRNEHRFCKNHAYGNGLDACPRHGGALISKKRRKREEPQKIRKKK